MVGMPIIGETAGIVDSSCTTGDRHEGFEQGGTVHQGEFTTAGAVNDLRVGTAGGLFDHTIKGVIGQGNGSDGDGVAIGVPGEGAESIVEGVSIGIVGGGDAAHGGHAIGNGG